MSNFAIGGLSNARSTGAPRITSRAAAAYLMRWIGLLASVVVLSACNFAAPPGVTPTATAMATMTPTATPNGTPTPSHTPTLSPTPTMLPTVTPTASHTPTITPTPLPTWTPAPAAAFVGDHLTRIDIPKPVQDSVGKQIWLSFVNVSDANPRGTPGTPVAASNQETVYLVSPDGGTRLKVIDLPASVDRRAFWSPNGAYLAYFLPDGDAPGLYLIDVRNRTSERVFNITDLTPRGFLAEPVWSADSSQLTIDLTTAYAVNIFSLNVDGTNFRQLPPGSGSFDLWPTWSPDGAYLAFVSDRGKCPSWQPGAASSCYIPGAQLPTGGGLYVIDASGKQVRQLSAQLITTPPHWLSTSRLSYTVGGALWWVDLRDGSTHQVTNLDPSDSTFAVRDAWSPDGRAVLYQEAGTSTRIVLRADDGSLTTALDQFNFPRYSFTVAWSPDGKRIAFGGHNGQCPFGLIMADPQLNVTLKAPPTPSACDPIWSPDSKYLAFDGITQSNGSSAARDGRYDLYVAAASGLGAHNLTGNFGGLIRTLGWIGG